MKTLLFLGILIAAGVLTKVFLGLLRSKTVEQESLASVEVRHPYLPKYGAIIVSAVMAGVLFVLSLKYGQKTSLQSFVGTGAWIRTAIIFFGIVGFGFFDRVMFKGAKDRKKYFYAFILGTLATWILIAFKRAFFETGIGHDPFLMALGIVCVIVGWKFLFGPWSEEIKATVLGTFILWSAYAILRFETQEQLVATAIALVVALIPVVAWCWLFLRYHKEKPAVVVLAFFAGMLSTVPILFYQELMVRGIELNFFLFKVTPVSFQSSSRDFINGGILNLGAGVQSIVLAGLVTYLVVGTIEEVSKFWVIRHSSKEFFRSIDDVLQISIIVAIGFAFAENLVNPTYFVGFVRQYILLPESPMWGPFIGAVVGRGVLTSMVHIVSTGVLGYFFGLSFYAHSLLTDASTRGKKFHPLLALFQQAFGVRQEKIFAKYQVALGVVAAIVLHGIFDFTVSLPDMLPGNPSTVGQLIGPTAPGFLNGISITLLPSILYVVGGFWLLAWLFQRAEDMKEYGQMIESQTAIS